MEKELKSYTGVLLRADITGHGLFCQSANFCQKGWDGRALSTLLAPHIIGLSPILPCYISELSHSVVILLKNPLKFLNNI